jgi:iron-sulfur cluster repair protein YtfE (RIC family)
MSEDAQASVPITLETTLLDIVSRYPETEKVFKKLEADTGACVCCQALFVSLREAAEQFGFDAGRVLADLEVEINQGHKAL